MTTTTHFMQQFNALNDLPNKAELEKLQLREKKKNLILNIILFTVSACIALKSCLAIQYDNGDAFHMLTLMFSVFIPMLYLTVQFTKNARDRVAEAVFQKKQDFLFKEKNLVALMAAILKHPAALEQVDSSQLTEHFKICCEAIQKKDRKKFNRFVSYLITTADEFEDALEAQLNKAATLKNLHHTIFSLGEKYEPQTVVSQSTKTNVRSVKSFSYSK